MRGTWRALNLVVLLVLAAVSGRGERKEIAVPGGRVEYFVEIPQGKGPWPTVVFLHGHQEGTRPGGRDFLNWNVLNRYAKRGYLAVAISQPGYGQSDGPADFCGRRTQLAVRSVLQQLHAEGAVAKGRLALVGISRGAIVSGLLSAGDSSIAGVVLISGVYDLNEYVAKAEGVQSGSVVAAIRAETGGSDAELKSRSVIPVAQTIRARTLILNGALDDRTSPNQAWRLASVIEAGGGRAEVIVYPKHGHLIPPSVREKTVDHFLSEVLGEGLSAR